MNSKFPDDLLSAFFDGEVTPTEETVARIQLGASPQAKQEFEAYQRLSKELQDLPRQTAPMELASAVLHQAERESLLAETAAAAPAVVFAASGSRQFWRTRTFMAGVAVAGIAAAVLAAVMIVPTRKEKQSLALSEPRRVATLRVRGGEEKGAPFHLDRALARSERGSGPALQDSAKDRPLASPGSSVGKPAAAEVATASRTAFGLTAKEGLSTESGARREMSQMIYPADLKTAKVGDVIEAFERTEGEIAVVRLKVLDQAEGLDGIRKILVRNSRRPIRDAGESAKVRSKFAAAKQSAGASDNFSAEEETPLWYKADTEGQLLCVFVEGTRAEMTGVLQDLQNENHIREARLTNVISASQLDRYAKNVVSQQKKSRQPSQIVALPASALDTLNLGKSSGAKSSSQSPEASEREQQLAQSLNSMASPSQPDVNSPAKKKHPALPATTAAKSVPQRGDSPVVALDGKSLFGDKQRKPGGRSYQVFFVLDDESIGAQKRSPVVAPRPAAKRTAPAQQASPR